MDKKAQGSLVVALIGVFIFAIVATALLPTIADQIHTATNGTGASNLSSTDKSLINLWPTFIIIGGLLAILAAVGLS